MIQANIIEALQLLIFMLTFMLITYHVVQGIRFFTYANGKLAPYPTYGRAFLDYVQKLYVVNYESYHKYQIWRFYIFS